MNNSVLQGPSCSLDPISRLVDCTDSSKKVIKIPQKCKFKQNDFTEVILRSQKLIHFISLWQNIIYFIHSEFIGLEILYSSVCLYVILFSVYHKFLWFDSSLSFSTMVELIIDFSPSRIHPDLAKVYQNLIDIITNPGQTNLNTRHYKH